MTNSYAPKVKKLRSGVAPVAIANPEIKISVAAEQWR
eukprot:CAMPEP_0172301164 /NCGR_PEP_ID=MMETSP1058-20130122/3111_1 /TAXON_ID=83371 /ORGANISM="Detonula confervacea, Strain CCMP 353" /LENGTH=36 /DNA_ID= /DNA_START= /DNA_END= /DNA_ORIENTATION=